MSEEPAVKTVIEALRNRGRVRCEVGWMNGNPDYVKEHSLTAQHIPALIELATKWVDEPPENASVYGPIHAWRALGQMCAVEAVQPLLNTQDKLAERHDDWYLQEYRQVFGLIGPPAIKPLAAYLADASHGEFPRGSAASGLGDIVTHYPETREEVVAILTAELARHQLRAEILNGFLLAELLDLEAAESAEVIEQAFAANVIDPTIAGDWGDVRHELNVPGLGIAPDHSPGWRTIREQYGFFDPADNRQIRSNDRKKQQAAAHQEKAKQKEKKKQKKRNRKSR